MPLTLRFLTAFKPQYLSLNKGEQQCYQTFWQLCINKHGLRPPPFSLFVKSRPPFCHRTPVRDCLQAAEPCLGLGPKPDNLTVIHSKLIKHLQRCHDIERALFISVLHHQHAGRPRYARGVSIYLCKWDSSARWWAGDWQPDLCIEIINKYSSIMGGVTWFRKCLAVKVHTNSSSVEQLLTVQEVTVLSRWISSICQAFVINPSLL